MKTFANKQQGMTLTELMVAVAVGLVVSAAVAGLFLQTTASNNQNEEVTYLQDNGRYALKLMADDLEMSNFWAGLAASNSGGIATDNATIALDGGAATIQVTIDQTNVGCSASTANWNYTFANPLAILINTTGTNAIAAYPCINNADVALDFVDGTDVLMVKRTKGLEETSSQTNGRPYIRGNRTVATVHKYVSGATDDPPTGYFDWQYINHIYYIARDQGCSTCVPKLVRQTLKEDSSPSNDPSFSTEVIAEGIERFHIMFGVDTNGDAVVDTFLSSPTAAQLGNTVIAKIYILARSEKEVMGYNNTKQYQLGDLTVGPFSDDHYYRRVFTTTVVMKNTEAVLQMAACC